MNNSNTFYITVLYKEFLKYTELKLKKIGLTYGQLPFILYIGKNEMCSPAALKKELKKDWGYVQRMLTKLEKDGYISKIQSDEKKVSYYLKLTELGSQAFEISHDVFNSWDNHLEKYISKEEWITLGNILEKVYKGIEI